MVKKRFLISFSEYLLSLFALIFCLYTPASAGDPYSAYYSPDTDQLLWFVIASDAHIGTSGSTDTTNLQWLVGQAKNTIDPSFIVLSGDLTDSTNGNIFGYPNGPYQEEWDQYKNILNTNGIEASFFFDIPGNHDAYNDQYFSYYLANSVQGRETGRTQASWTRLGPWGKFHFLGLNTADNTGDPFSLFWPYGDYAGLDSSELAFISNEMTAHGDAALTLVFGHHPLAPTGNSSDTYLYYGKVEFVSLMDNHGASLYGYGHTHVTSEQYFSQNMTDGVFYFNVSALGKDSPNQYTIAAIDCNGISAVTQNVGTWPVVLITAPMDRRLGGLVNPYAYQVTNAATNPIRALVFDPAAVTQVQFRVNGGIWQPMANVPGNSRLWQGLWDASTLAEAEYTVDVQATTGSGSRLDTVKTYLKSQTLPLVGVADAPVLGKYVTSGKGKNKTLVFTPASDFKQGETVVIRMMVKDSAGATVANATVNLAITGPASTNLTSGPSDSSGLAEATWATTAPNKRGKGGTPTGAYTVTITNVTAAGYPWNGIAWPVSFSIIQ
ncbi:MAG: metallophosphoesterase [Syntrophaceae bacterium]|nr:metallophosphoesterase [Syntrophaceae bacterium]